MVTLLINPAQVPPGAVSTLTPGMLVPIIITAIICTTVLGLVSLTMRGTESRHRANVLRAVADIVRSLGRAVRDILDAVGRFLFGGGPGGSNPAV